MINKNNCFVCQRIELIKQNKNQYFVRELKSGYVVLADYQYFYGYTIFISKIHIDELYKLGKTQKLFLEEMAKVAEAVIKTFKPKKLNYELLGNTDSHLHWHLIPATEMTQNQKLLFGRLKKKSDVMKGISHQKKI